MGPHVIMSLECVLALQAGLELGVKQVSKYSYVISCMMVMANSFSKRLTLLCIIVECSQGQYGLNCIEKCSCRNNTECHHVTGICSCHRGYTGENCLQGGPAYTCVCLS